jgi:hypothetical protein
MGSDLDNRTYHEVPLQDFQKGGIPLVEVRETTAKTLSAPCNVLKELNPTDPGVIGRDSAGGLRLVNPWVSHKIGDIIMNSNVNPYDAWAFGGKVVWINPAGDVVYSCPFSVSFDLSVERYPPVFLY